MKLDNSIILRPRFKLEVAQPNDQLLKKFEETSAEQSEFIVNRIDDHVFIRFPKQKQEFWSPQLHLEIIKKDDQSATVHGLFGPNPNIWTLFMFFHFVVATLFIVCGIWAYTNSTLGESYALQLYLTLFMILLWLVLYIAGRMGRRQGGTEMHKLNEFMHKTLNKLDD